MTADVLKNILDTLVMADDCDFTVEFTNRRYALRRADYVPLSKQIRIHYTGPGLRYVCSGIHELAHHLCRKHHLYRGHGKRYIRTLDGLVKTFNAQYRDAVKMELVLNKRAPATKSLRFVAIGENGKARE